jgi:FG-GAP-like repeat
MRAHSTTNRAATVMALTLAWSYAASAGVQSQDDWSQGVTTVPAPVYGGGFDSSDAVSWRAVPGRLALQAHAVAVPVRHPVAGGLTVVRQVHGADLDGDGDADVVHAAYGAVMWWERQGVQWTRHDVSNDFEGAEAIDPADIDGDGDLDLAAAAFYGGPGLGENGRFAWFENADGHGQS